MKSIQENKRRISGIFMTALSLCMMLLTVSPAFSESPDRTKSNAAQMPASLSAIQASNSRRDSIANALKYKELTKRKTELESSIKKEDAKRNQYPQGVSPEHQEELNIRQDSLCLSLRSELVCVELQMAEIHPEEKLTDLLGRIGGQFVHQETSTDGTSGQSPTLYPYVDVVPGKTTQHGDQSFTPYVEVVPQKHQDQQTQQQTGHK